MRLLVNEEEVTNVTKEEKNFTNEAVVNLHRCIIDMTNALPTVPGSVAYALEKNAAKVVSVMKRFEQKRYALLFEVVERDEKGNLKITNLTEEEIKEGKRQEYVFKNDELKADYNKKTLEILKTEAEEIEFHKIPLSVFNNLNVPQGRINFLDLFIEQIIDETK